VRILGCTSNCCVKGGEQLGDLIQMNGGDSEIFQELYDSGIDVSIAFMAGAGFLVELGMDGAMIDARHVRSYAEASRWLKQAAIRHYPFSAFGRKHRGSAKVVTLSKPSPQPFWTS
jgi:hypothetical protein